MRRIIIKMLKHKMIKESFVSMKYGATNSPNIQVYLQPGRYSQNLLNHTKPLKLIDGVDVYDDDDDDGQLEQDPFDKLE